MSLLTTAPARRGAPRPAPRTEPRRDQRPPLRLVPPPAPARRRVRMGMVGTVVLAAVLVGVFALAAVHALVVQAQFELDRIDQQVADRRGELDALRLQVAELEAPRAVADAAAEIGMVTPQHRVYLEPVISGSGDAPAAEPRTTTGRPALGP